MRRTLTVCRGGLSVAAAVLLLTACGGSDDDTSASRESSSSASASGSAAGSEFCTEAARALSELEPAFTDQGGDPAALAPALQEAADKVRAIDPPSQIASDWTALGDGIEQFAQAFGEVDVNDPASASALQQRTSEIIGQLSMSATNVETYLSEECGLQTPTGSSAPTS
jgi:hypothetical protein